MLELIKERKVLKDNSTFFKLLKVALERDLTEKEKNKFLESSYRNIGYLEEEFKCANESHTGNYNDGIITRNGIVLVSQLRDGLNITKDNFIKENIEQFSAHYQCVKEYEEAFVTYRDNRFTESYFRTIETYNEAIDYSDGYTMKKTLTKC